MTHEPAAMEELKSVGVKAVPTTLIEGRPIIGFDPTALSKALGLTSVEIAPPDPADLLRRYDIAFSAAIRALAQVPSERLDQTSPEHHLDLRTFGFHTFRWPGLGLEARESGHATFQDLMNSLEQELPAYTTTESIVELGRGTLARLREFLERATPDALGQEVEGHYGRTSIGQVLELCLGHTTHHIRQLYGFLRGMGITPESPLSEEDFRELGTPTFVA